MPAAPVPRLVVFDLDGTLVDSLRDIAQSLNACLELLGLPQLPVKDYRYMVGEGVPTLCRRAIGESHPHYVNRLIELSRPRYRVGSLIHTRPYPGIPNAVTAIRRAGVQLGVLSNKPHDMTVRMIRHFWPDGEFEFTQGYVEERYRKPDPYYLRRMCDAAGVDPRNACLVGDTPTDVQTAANAGTAMIGVTWGFRTCEDLVSAGVPKLVSSPAEMLAALGINRTSAVRESGGIYIALGANLGDRAATIAGALRSLQRGGEITVQRMSALHDTAPVGGPANQAPYLNGAAELETGLSPQELLQRMLEVEREFGRTRAAGQRDEPRTLDLDLLVYRDVILDEPGLTLPHPRMWQRDFVLRPLSELCDVGALRRRFEQARVATGGRPARC